jgi:uncharacterized protein YdaT
MKIGPAQQHYGFIQTQRVNEQAKIQHQTNLKNLEKMNRQTVQNAEAYRATQRMELAKWDRVRQMQEAYLGQACQKYGHNETTQHVDVKV